MTKVFEPPVLYEGRVQSFSAVLDKRKIYSIRDLPTLPIFAQKFLSLADDEEGSSEKLAQIISSDQSLAVKVLSLANSAYYGQRAQIGTVKQALIVIGIAMLKQISLSVLVFKALGGSQRDRIAFFRHSLLTANAAATIGKAARLPSADVCFMAGLLHDVGKLVLDANLGEEYRKVRTLVEKEGCPFQEAERRILDTDHAEVGAWMGERWQLPAALVHSIRSHHEDPIPISPHGRAVAAVHAGNVCAAAVERLGEAGSEDFVITLPDSVSVTLGIPQAQYTDIVTDLHSRRAQIDQFLT
jgi:putative nucleotidyltransferase with HDIG domain